MLSYLHWQKGLCSYPCIKSIRIGLKSNLCHLVLHTYYHNLHCKPVANRYYYNFSWSRITCWCYWYILNFQKAFYSVPHKRLLHKIEVSVGWIDSFQLSDRRQLICCSKWLCLSSWSPLGVNPQTSSITICNLFPVQFCVCWWY